MKKIILLIGFASILNCASTQETNCVNGVSTNHNNPTNNSLPINSPSPDYGQKFLNKFDWVPRSINQTVAKYQTINMNSNILDAGEIQNINSNQQNPFYSYLYNDIEPNSINTFSEEK